LPRLALPGALPHSRCFGTIFSEDLVRLRIAAVDLISNTCFPALAADALGYFKAEGLDASIELAASLGATRALRAGDADAMIAGSVHDVLTEYPNWEGVKIAVALSQGTPWLLTVRADLDASRGDLEAVRGLRLTATAGPDLALKTMLKNAGIDPMRDVQLVELPGARARDVSFGVFAARALEAGHVDGFWANAMGAETAVSRGVGKVLIDVRRGDDPGEVRFFTFAGMTTTNGFIAREPEAIGAAVRAIVKAQKALRADPSLARAVGRQTFPPDAAELIANVVARDVEFYDPVISETAVEKMNRFARLVGHLSRPMRYEDVVAVEYRGLWTS
jgi:ABC-type nitrate/sulfonate/bicarbonate transport system substrate-binding protein